MKKLRKILTLCLALVMCLSCAGMAFAAEVDDATIHEDANCSLTIWKFDWTNALKDGVWNEDSFISTGWRESYVEEVLGEGVRQGDANGSPDNALGNGQNANGYAIKGVEFSYLRVADIVTFTESANDQHPEYNQTMVLYGFDKVKAADLLSAIGLPDGAGRYENADNTDTPSPPATSDRIVASSEASTWMRFAFGGSSFSAYCSAQLINGSFKSRSMEMRSRSQRNDGGTTATRGTRVSGIHSKPSAQVSSTSAS